MYNIFIRDFKFRKQFFGMRHLIHCNDTPQFPHYSVTRVPVQKTRKNVKANYVGAQSSIIFDFQLAALVMHHSDVFAMPVTSCLLHIILILIVSYVLLDTQDVLHEASSRLKSSSINAKSEQSLKSTISKTDCQSTQNICVTQVYFFKLC